MMAARVQALIGVAGETITYKRVTHGSYSTATLQSSPSVQSYAIKAGVWQYRAREIVGLVQQGDREMRIAAADLSLTPRPNDQVVIAARRIRSCRSIHAVHSMRLRFISCRSGAGMGDTPSLTRDGSHWPAGHCIFESSPPLYLSK
jgi:hypothetical protein